MPNVSSVNLRFLNNSAIESATALIQLADFANGPLRLEKKVVNGVTIKYLGVRSWSTYFFEKLVATPAQKTKAKIKTQAAIEEHVRSFLNNSGLNLLGRDAEGITATLQSKVIGKSVTPPPIAKMVPDQKGKAATKPTYAEPAEVVQIKGAVFRGVAIVPKGLSVAVISPLRVIANVRLVTEATYKMHPRGDSRNGLTVPQGYFVVDKRNGVVDYKTQYLTQLNSVAGLIETSVVLEVQPDSEGKCSQDNQEGARIAAKEFVENLGSKGKHVSVMLTVPKLPTVTQPESATVKEIDTAAKRKPDDILVDSSEYSEESSD